MKNRSSYSYSHAYNVKWALEQELNCAEILDLDEKVVVYLRERIVELKEMEKECLKIQSLLTK